MKITVLSGGDGGSRFIDGLLRAKEPNDEVTVIANTTDGISLFGMRISSDLDTAMCTLGDGIDRERGWDRTHESWAAKSEVEAYGIEEAWFGLGDRDIATHLVRTMRLQEGRTLSEVTAELCERWQPGVRLLPMTDDRAETHIGIDRDAPGVVEAITDADVVLLPPPNPVVSITARADPLWMSDDISTAQLARDAPDLAVTLRASR